VRRRDFITCLGVALCWPVRGRAQQADRVRRIGVLLPYAENDAEAKSHLSALTQQLKRLGWSEDRNIRIDVRYAAGIAEQYPALAKELAALQPDVFLSESTPAAAALKQETGTIPIVFVGVSDPVGSGFVTSLARPGGDLTGMMQYESGILGKWLAMLKEVAPHLTRVAFVANPKFKGYDYFWRFAQAAAPALAIELIPSQISNDTADVERAIESFARVPEGPSSYYRMRRSSPTAISSFHLLRATVCRPSILGATSSQPAHSCLTELTTSTCCRRRPPMSIASCAAQSPSTCRCRRRPNTKRL
jgi:putative tryptophan/tyrosine transport system substrate-binding protein